MSKILSVRTQTCAALFLAAATGIPAAMALESVRLHDEPGVISVQGKNLIASDIAREIGLKLDINVVITGNADTAMDLDIVEEPLGQAIGKISPNNLVVRETSDPASPIVEIVMMMASASGGVSAGANADDLNSEFLPVAEPAQPQALDDGQVMPDELPFNADSELNDLEPVDPYELRDPGRILQVREAAAAAAADSGLPPVQIPPMFTPDPEQFSDSVEFNQ